MLKANSKMKYSFNVIFRQKDYSKNINSISMHVFLLKFERSECSTKSVSRLYSSITRLEKGFLLNILFISLISAHLTMLQVISIRRSGSKSEYFM